MCLAIPAGISISGCSRNPGENYCNGSGYGLKITDVQTITLQPATTGISLAYGQTRQVTAPTATTCKSTAASVSTYTYGTTNNQLVDISPAGSICAGTWNRNTGGGIANYTICSAPSPLPSTGGLPYATAYITAAAQSVTSNPVAVYVHAPVTTVALVGPSSCVSQGDTAQLDAQACYSQNVGGTPTNVLLCAPSSVTSASSACAMPAITPDIIKSGAIAAATGNISSASYTSGGSIQGTEGQTCQVSGFNSGSSGASATVALTGANAIASGTPLVLVNGGSGASAAPTTATLSSGTATCSGTVNVASVLANTTVGAAGGTCNLTTFNNGSTGATATVVLTGTNTIALGTPLTLAEGGVNATTPPTTAVLSSSSSATCSGTVPVTTSLTKVPTCANSIGTLSFSVGTSSVATLNSVSNAITAVLPGTTIITATLTGAGSTAGYFSTCPPEKIAVTLNGKSGADNPVTVTQGVTQNLTTVITDTKGATITGLSLDYQSTDPVDISSGSGGSITTTFPGTASITAICQPSTCNPAPTNMIGLYGTGVPLSSDPVVINTPGTASDYAWFGAPGSSRYVIPMALLSGTVGSTIKLPYVPNSMIMDRTASSLYMGSDYELMVLTLTASGGSLSTQNTNIHGKVLAVAPNNQTVLINDPAQQLFYIYSVSGSSTITHAGMGSSAAWTPDSKTLYITDKASLGAGHSDTLYVYNVNSGWAIHDLSGKASTGGSESLAITVPSVGAYLSGSAGFNTIAHTWCPIGTVGNTNGLTYYPQSDDSIPIETDVLAATTDGNHILGAAISGGELTLADIGVTIPTTACTLSTPLSTDGKLLTTPPLSVSAIATAVNQVVPSPVSNLAFITYTGDTTGASLPYYVPGAKDAAGTLGYVTLTGNSNITAPLAGAFTPDDKYFFVSTAGDNLVHFISVPSAVSAKTPLTDTKQISPNLPACTSLDTGCTYSGSDTIVPATYIAVKPRSTT
jgi:hypothetical protein